MVPFKVKTQQELLPLDFERRRIFSEWFLQQQKRFVQNIVLGDVAAFHMNGRINSQNNMYYALADSHPEKHISMFLLTEKKFQYGQDCLEKEQ